MLPVMLGQERSYASVPGPKWLVTDKLGYRGLNPVLDLDSFQVQQGRRLLNGTALRQP